MRMHPRLLGILAVAGLLSLAVLGCGLLPNAPASSTGTLATGPQAAEPAGLISNLVDGVVGLLLRTLNLIGSLGGTLINGRWKVVIPAGAVDGNATISLGVLKLDSPQCALQITPADKNHFSVPVILTVDCRSVPSDQLKSYVILWLDPSTGNWVPVEGSKVDLTNKTVSAPLQHFSQYSVGNGGKAGW